MRLFMKRYGTVPAASDTDTVMFGFPLPPGATLNRLRGEIHLEGPEESLVGTALMYGMQGYIIPVSDLDAVTTYNTLWDTFVPKDEAELEGGIDLDEAADAQPFLGVGGEINWEDVFSLAPGQVKKFFEREKLITVASRPVGYSNRSAATDVWMPTDVVNLNIRRRYRVAGASVAMMALSSPVFDQSDLPANIQVVPTEKNWVQYAFLNYTLRQALIDAIALVEVGAESPYADALAFVSKLLEPDLQEDAAAIFANVTWRCYFKVTADVTIPDRGEFRSVSG